MTRRYSSGRRRNWRRPKVTGRPSDGTRRPSRPPRRGPGARSSASSLAGGARPRRRRGPVGRSDSDEASSSSGVANVPGHGPAVGDAVQQRAGRREAERAGADRLVDQLAPWRRCRRQSAGVSSRLRSPMACDAHRAVPDHAADVDALGRGGRAAEVLAVGLPVPGEAVEDRVGGDVLDALHQLGQQLAVARAHGGERDAAVADDDAGDAVPAGRACRAGPRRAGRRGGCGCRRSRA